MYINSLHINKYKVLEDLKIDFQIPEDSNRDNGNIVNVIAGVNGSGKTSLLEWVFYLIGRFGYHNNELNKGNYKLIEDGYIEIDNQKFELPINLLQYLSKETKNFTQNNTYKNGIHSSPRVVSIPSKMSFEYKTVNQLDNSYKFDNLIDPSKILGNAEFFIKKFIEDKIFFNDEDRSNKELKKEAIEDFNSIFENSEFVTKLIDLDKDNNRRPIFQTINGETVTIEKLSSGEQQLYARVVSLMILNPQNSIILIDEPEIALHPKWQTEIMKIYANIGKNNQFIVSTHSPFIISQTHYKNLTFLAKENNKIVAKQFKSPPLDRDINTIIKTVMGANYLPSELEKLHSEYRELFDKEEEQSEQGKELEKKIREWENENSSFWQSIAFDRELRDF